MGSESTLVKQNLFRWLEIEAIVAARLGPGRVRGSAQSAAFSRQVAMYLASQVGKWSTIEIGKFYSGRDHSTVCYTIARIRMLREFEQGVDDIVTVLAEEIGVLTEWIGSGAPHKASARGKTALLSHDGILDAIAERITSRIRSCLVGSIPAVASAAKFSLTPAEM